MSYTSSSLYLVYPTHRNYNQRMEREEKRQYIPIKKNAAIKFLEWLKKNTLKENFLQQKKIHKTEFTNSHLTPQA